MGLRRYRTLHSASIRSEHILRAILLWDHLKSLPIMATARICRDNA